MKVVWRILLWIAIMSNVARASAALGGWLGALLVLAAFAGGVVWIMRSVAGYDEPPPPEPTRPAWMQQAERPRMDD